MKNKEFPCSGCSGCCRLIGRMIANPDTWPKEMVKEIAAFPYPANDDGTCSMLDEAGKCKVYKTRPDMCNINKTFVKYYKKKETRRQFFKRNIVSCHRIIDTLGIDPALKPKM